MDEAIFQSPEFRRFAKVLERNFQAVETFKGENGITDNNLDLLQEAITFIENVFPRYAVLLYGRMKKRIYVSESVKEIFGLTASEFLALSDEGMIARIHPDDWEPMAKVLERMMDDISFDCRYLLNFRYRFGQTEEYIHLSYERIILSYKNYNFTWVLMRDISKEQPFKRVTLRIRKKIGKQVFEMGQFVPEKEELITSRENEIISLIHKGLKSSEIANILSISTNTVRNHRKNIFRKLNIRSSVELVNFIHATRSNKPVSA